MQDNRFIGNYVQAESANNYIDMAAINSAIDKICKEIEDLESVKAKIETSTDNFRKENLSFFGKDMEEDLHQMEEKIDENIQKLRDYINALLNGSERAFSKKQDELNSEAEKKEKQEEQRIEEEKERQRKEEEKAKEKQKEEQEKLEKEEKEKEKETEKE